MGFLDDVKDKFEDAGDKAEDVFEAAKRQAIAAIDDLKDRLDVNDDGEHTVGEVFEAAKAKASSAIESLKDKVSGDDNTTVGEARLLVHETTPEAEDVAPVNNPANAPDTGTGTQTPAR